MKPIMKIFDWLRPTFSKDGKLAPLKPVFDAADNFFFAPRTVTLAAPHVRDPLDVKRFMTMVIIAVLPCLATAFYFFGWRMIPMIIVSYAAGGLVEVIFAVVRKEEINEGFLVTGMLFPLILPPATPLWLVGVGIAFGVLVGKELFGGTGRNLFNPALVGRCFLSLAYPATMSGKWIEPVTQLPGRMLQYVDASSLDALSSATPLAAAKSGEITNIWQMFFGNVSGSLGETSAIAIIVGGVFLQMTKVANWRTPLSIFVSFAILATALNIANPEKFLPAYWHLCAGGLMFGAFYMATDPVTSPITNTGKYFYGIIIGVVTVLIRNFTGYVEGVTFAILLGNIIAPLLDEIVFQTRFRRIKSEG